MVLLIFVSGKVVLTGVSEASDQRSSILSACLCTVPNRPAGELEQRVR